jgi:hypothetical protein
VCYATSQVDDEEEENMSMGAAGPGTGIVQILRKKCYNFVATHRFLTLVTTHGHIY